jgi:transposase InsO family protein
MPDAALLAAIRAVLAGSPFHGEGHRKVWARLRVEGVRTSKRRVLRLMGENDLTTTITREGQAAVFIAVDHCSAECVGIHAARRATRFEALEPLRQGVREKFDGFAKNVARGLSVRHDHGSQYMSDVFQNELEFLGIESSPTFVRAPDGNGCAERFIRTLKENLLSVQTFDTIDELRSALIAFRKAYNTTWLIQRHGFLSPAAFRQNQLQPVALAA